MTNRELRSHANRFQRAIVSAQQEGALDEDTNLRHFPKRSCRDASYLLAEYFHRMGTDTMIVFTDDRSYGSHAWLVVKDDRILTPKWTRFEYPESIKPVIDSYGGPAVINNNNYKNEDIASGTIIDITGSQYDERYDSVYVGPMDDFHEQFDFRSAVDYDGYLDSRLNNLYDIISRKL